MSRRRRTAANDPVRVLRAMRAPWWIIALAAVAVWVYQTFLVPQPVPVDPTDPGRTYLVERVVDGDTLVLLGGERVRLIGVDTPETVKPNSPVEPFGPEATAFTKRFVEGKSVRLEFDRERRDKYGRTLAYVHLAPADGEQGAFLNEELLRVGLARAETRYPFSPAMKRRFLDAQAAARAERRGLWSLPHPPSSGGRSSR